MHNLECACTSVFIPHTILWLDHVPGINLCLYSSFLRTCVCVCAPDTAPSFCFCMPAMSMLSPSTLIPISPKCFDASWYFCEEFSSACGQPLVSKVTEINRNQKEDDSKAEGLAHRFLRFRSCCLSFQDFLFFQGRYSRTRKVQQD